MSKKRSSGRQKPAKKRRLPDRLVFFIDECLGGRRLAEALKVHPNVDAILLQEEFERGCDDVAWIPEVAANRPARGARAPASVGGGFPGGGR